MHGKYMNVHHPGLQHTVDSWLVTGNMPIMHV